MNGFWLVTVKILNGYESSITDLLKKKMNYEKKLNYFLGNLDKIRENSIYCNKGKPVERQGRKAKGLRSKRRL